MSKVTKTTFFGLVFLSLILFGTLTQTLTVDQNWLGGQMCAESFQSQEDQILNEFFGKWDGLMSSGETVNDHEECCHESIQKLQAIIQRIISGQEFVEMNQITDESRANLTDLLNKEIEAKLDTLIEDFKKEKDVTIDFKSRNGLRQRRKFKSIVNESVSKDLYEQQKEMLKQTEEKIVARFQQFFKSTSKEVQIELMEKPDFYEFMSILFNQLWKYKKQYWYHQVVDEILGQVSNYAKENILVLPNINKQKKFASGDPYKGKQMVYISDKERNFVPTIEDEFFVTSWGLHKRKVFGEPTIHSAQENQNWEEFVQYFEKTHNQKLPQFYVDPVERRGHRHLTYRLGKFSREEAMKWTADDVFWWLEQTDKKEPTPDYLKYLQKGAFYVSGRLSELGHQPVFVVDAYKFVKMPQNKMPTTCQYYLQWIKDNMIVWGRIEGKLVIIDMDNIKLRDLPLKGLWDLGKNVFRFYIGGAHRTVLVNSSWLFKILLDLASNWFDAETMESVFMVEQQDTFQTLLGYLTVDEIEQKYGGNKPNINQFYPPIY